MMARLWADKVIERNKRFSEVPPRLKEDVREILIFEHHEDLLNS